MTYPLDHVRSQYRSSIFLRRGFSTSMGGPFQKPQALNRYLRKLQRIADEHGVAVVITNQAPAEGRRWVLARWKKGLVVKDQDGVLTSIVFMNKNRIRDFFWG